MNAIANIVAKCQANVAVKMALAKLNHTGKIEGLKICMDGHNLQIDSIVMEYDNKDFDVSFTFDAMGTRKMEECKAPLEVSGTGACNIKVTGIKYSYGNNEFELGNMEFSSAAEAMELVASFTAAGMQFG